MKLTLIAALSFFAFFSSCNIFTLTGASSGVYGEFMADKSSSSSPPPPIVTSSASSSLSGSINSGNCAISTNVNIYGASLTTSTQYYLFNTSTNIEYNISVTDIDSTEISISLSGDFPSGFYGVKAVNENGSSKAFVFQISCA